jgi:mono/diheme cytochrome c family protein
VLALIVVAGCDRGGGDIREWTPADHDQPTAAQGQVSARPGSEGPDPMLLDMAWRKNCATCHGSAGRGDGPQGAMARAPDLSRADWQEKVTDDEIAATIRNGKNKMPKFDLPDQVVSGLVQRVRAFRAK